MQNIQSRLQPRLQPLVIPGDAPVRCGYRLVVMAVPARSRAHGRDRIGSIGGSRSMKCCFRIRKPGQAPAPAPAFAHRSHLSRRNRSSRQTACTLLLPVADVPEVFHFFSVAPFPIPPLCFMPISRAKVHYFLPHIDGFGQKSRRSPELRSFGVLASVYRRSSSL